MTTSHTPKPITSISQQDHTYTVLQGRCNVCYEYVLSMTEDADSGWYHRETGLKRGFLPYGHDAEPIL